MIDTSFLNPNMPVKTTQTSKKGVKSKKPAASLPFDCSWIYGGNTGLAHESLMQQCPVSAVQKEKHATERGLGNAPKSYYVSSAAYLDSGLTGRSSSSSFGVMGGSRWRDGS